MTPERFAQIHMIVDHGVSAGLPNVDGATVQDAAECAGELLDAYQTALEGLDMLRGHCAFLLSCVLSGERLNSLEESHIRTSIQAVDEVLSVLR